MFVDTNAILALGSGCSTNADDLSTTAAELKSLPGTGAVAALGPIGAGFLAALADAVTTEARAIVGLSEELASGRSVTGVAAEAYDDADRHGSRLL
jgi:Excreted virulence factor EspC, type VII ESX diderm